MRLKQFGIKTISSVVSLALVLCFVFEHQSKAAAHNAFGNMVYLTTYPEFAKSVTLVNGRHGWNNGYFFYNLSYEGYYVYGDFNNDGLKDAAVIISEGEGGSGDFRALAFLINDGQHLVHRVSRGLGDRARILSLKAYNGRVTVDMFVHQDGDCMAGPTKRVKNVYEFSGPDAHGDKAREA